jgi:peptide/nickel transport system permease protein
LIKYFGIRLTSLIPKLLIITIIIFLALQLVPGDPITRSISPETYANLNEAQLNDLREKLGLNDNVIVQYFRWLSGILRGDFGYSLSTGGNIRDMLAQRLPATLELAVMGLIIATIFGLLFGFISAIKRNSFIDYFNTTIGMIGLSVPPFFFGLCGILLFSITLGWLPSGGRMGAGEEAFFDRFKYIIMPAFCLGISLIATLMRYTRGSMLDVLNKDYIKVARSKGLSEVKVNLKHGFRNALIPIMVILILRLPMLVGGTVVIETVFNYPGMGSLLIDAISGSDLPVVMIITMIIAAVILLSSFIVDIVSAMLDPRIRFAGKGGK